MAKRKTVAKRDSEKPYHGKHGKRWQRGKRWNGKMWVKA